MNKALLKQLQEAGLKWAMDAELPDSEGFFADKTFVLTGALSTMTRSEASSQIKALGGKVVSSVSKSTNALIAGDSPGSKYNRAQELGGTHFDGGPVCFSIESLIKSMRHARIIHPMA